jgi:hypothetical protein
VVDTPAAAKEDASLATVRWCRSRIVEGGPRRGAPTVIATIGAGAGVLSFPLPLALTLAFSTVVGAGGRRGRCRLRT